MSIRTHQELPLYLLLKVKQAHRGKRESVVDEERCYTTKEFKEFANLFKQKSGKYVKEWILRVWDSYRWNIKPDQAEFVDMDPLNGDSRFNTLGLTYTVKKDVRS